VRLGTPNAHLPAFAATSGGLNNAPAAEDIATQPAVLAAYNEIKRFAARSVGAAVPVLVPHPHNRTAASIAGAGLALVKADAAVMVAAGLKFRY
jgi:hypothetical protein